MAMTNLKARNDIIDRIASTPARHQFRSNSTKAKYLFAGESIVGIVGGFKNSIVFSPANVREPCDCDRYLFFGSNGVLVHEEAATQSPELHNLFATKNDPI